MCRLSRRDPSAALACARGFGLTGSSVTVAEHLENVPENRGEDLEGGIDALRFFREFKAHMMISEMLTPLGGEFRQKFFLRPRVYGRLTFGVSQPLRIPTSGLKQLRQISRLNNSPNADSHKWSTLLGSANEDEPTQVNQLIVQPAAKYRTGEISCSAV